MSLQFVSTIDWSNPIYNRGGIIPIYNDGKNNYLGLGINKRYTLLTTIGGSYESIDYDLLDSIVREYREEINDYLPNIGVSTLINKKALIMKNDVLIFLPIKYLPSYSFVETDELFDFIWITTKQLKILGANQKAKVNNNDIFSFGKLLQLSYLNIIDAIESGEAYLENDVTKLIRTPRLSFSLQKYITYDIDFLLSIIENNVIYLIGLMEYEDYYLLSLIYDKNYYYFIVNKVDLNKIKKIYNGTFIVPMDENLKSLTKFKRKLSLENKYNNGEIPNSEMIYFIYLYDQSYDNDNIENSISAITKMMELEDKYYTKKSYTNEYKLNLLHLLNDINNQLRLNDLVPYSTKYDVLIKYKLLSKKNKMIYLF